MGASAGPASAGTIAFSPYFSNVGGTGGVPLIPTALASPTHGGLFSSAWGWNLTGNASDPMNTLYHGLIANQLSSNGALSNAACIGAGGDCSANPAGYQGYEFIYFKFSLPSDATNVVLHLGYLDADDRVALSVNNTLLGGFAYSSHNQVGGASGTFNMNDAQGAHPVTFYNVCDAVYRQQYPRTFSGLGYNPGGGNYLEFWVNNTHQGLTGSAIPHISPGYLNIDPSALYWQGYIAFDQAGTGVPEPATLLLIGLGLLTIAVVRRRAVRA